MGFRHLLTKYALLHKNSPYLAANDHQLDSHSPISPNIPSLSSHPLSNKSRVDLASENPIIPPNIPSISLLPSENDDRIELSSNLPHLLPNIDSDPRASVDEIALQKKRKIFPIVYKGTQTSKHKNPLQKYTTKGKITTTYPEFVLTSGDEYSKYVARSLITGQNNRPEIRKMRIILLIRFLQDFFSFFEFSPYPAYFENTSRLLIYLSEFKQLRFQMSFMEFLKRNAKIPKEQIERFIYNSFLFKQDVNLIDLYAEYPKDMSSFYKLIEPSKMSPMLFHALLEFVSVRISVERAKPLVNRMTRLCLEYLKVNLENTLTWDMIYLTEWNIPISVPLSPSLSKEKYDLLQHNFFYYSKSRHALRFASASFQSLKSHIKRNIQAWDFEFMGQEVRCTSAIISKMFNNPSILPMQRIELLEALLDQLDPKIPFSCYFKYSSEEYDEIVAFVKEKTKDDIRLASLFRRWDEFLVGLDPDTAKGYRYARSVMQKQYRTTMKEVVRDGPDQCQLEEINKSIEDHMGNFEALSANICPLLSSCRELNELVKSESYFPNYLVEAGVLYCSHEHFHPDAFSTIVSNVINHGKRYAYVKMIDYCIKLINQGIEFKQCDLIKIRTRETLKDVNFYKTVEGKDFTKSHSLSHLYSLGFNIEYLIDDQIASADTETKEKWALELITVPKIFSVFIGTHKKPSDKLSMIETIAEFLIKSSMAAKFEELYINFLARLRSNTKNNRQSVKCESVPEEQVLHYAICRYTSSKGEPYYSSESFNQTMETINELEKQLPGYDTNFSTVF